MAEVVLESISKKFGDNTELDNVSMTIPDGSFVILLGPTGTCKTTMLRECLVSISLTRARSQPVGIPWRAWHTRDLGRDGGDI